MPLPDLDAHCSRFYRYRDLIECGETWARLVAEGRAEPNLPRRAATWRAIERLAHTILDPVHERFSALELTYGFASAALVKHIPRGIVPSLDQHAGSEVDRQRKLVCARRGLAVDFRVPGVGSTDVARWIQATIPFDRMYLYGDDRPLHVSCGPERKEAVYVMVRGARGPVPRRFKVSGPGSR